MEMNAQFAMWGIFFMSFMYLLGNIVWTNHMVRKNLLWGWLAWFISGLFVLILGHSIGNYLGGQVGLDALIKTLETSNLESYWIIFSLYALLSVPGAGCVIFKQSKAVTLMTILLPALVVLIPSSIALAKSTEVTYLYGAVIPICGLLFLCQQILDIEPMPKEQTS
ncbi:MAG: hypothetical protein Q9M28_08035 [Mariprofundaceae bacterium]|nr:hypothetical protein [Mariprofundaceae bacterium]